MAKKKTSDRAADGVAGHGAKAAAKEVDRVKVFAEKLREHKELESRWAVLHETRVEYFRGKDFVAVLEKHPELKNLLEGERPVENDEEAIGNLLLKRKLILRCDRVVKTVRPGKRKFSKWPGRVEIVTDQSFSEDDAFYAWTFERRRPLWQTILSFLVPIVTLACCLFPIFPNWCKLAVLYFCLTFLALIFGVLFVRWAIFGTMWILLGKSIWFFPNILAEEATLTELFHFWPEKSKDDDPPPKKTTRLAFLVLTVASVWVLLNHAPDEAARARYQKKVSNIIDEVLIWKPNLAAITGSSAEPRVTVNETMQNETEEAKTSNIPDSPDSSSFEVGDVEVGKEAPPFEHLVEADLIEDSSLQEEATADSKDDPVKSRESHDSEM